MFDFADKTLDQVPFTIQPLVLLTQDFGTLMWKNNGSNASIQQVFDEMSYRIAVIGDQMAEIKAFQQILRLGHGVLCARFARRVC
jgi:hypothetical protein